MYGVDDDEMSIYYIDMIYVKDDKITQDVTGGK